MEMDQSSSRLYSGQLSEAAMKILSVLRAQSLHVSRRNHSHSYRQMERFYGSQREALAQSSWSVSQEEESRDRGTQRLWTEPNLSSYFSSYHDSSNQQQIRETSPHYQHSQTHDSTPSSQSSAFSSSCWDSSLERQTRTDHQHSQIYSHRKCSEPPVLQSNQTPSFTQHEATETTTATSPLQRERFTPSIDSPESLFQHKATSWLNSIEEIRPSFDLHLSQDIHSPDEDIFAKRPHTKPPDEDISLNCHPVFFCPETSEETDNIVSNAQREKQVSEGFNSLNNYTDNQALWFPLSDPNEKTSSGMEKRGRLYQQHKSQITKTHQMYLPTRQETCGNVDLPTLMESLVGDEGPGQISNVKPKREGSVNEIGEKWLVKTKENFNLGRKMNLCLRNIMDKSFKCEMGGKKLMANEEREFENRVQTIKIKDHAPLCENKEPLVGCQTATSEKEPLSSTYQAENTQDMYQAASERGETYHDCVRQLLQREAKLLLAENLERSEEERAEVMDVMLGVETKSRTKTDINTSGGDKMEIEQPCCSDVKQREKQCETGHGEARDLSGGDIESEERDESLLPHVDGEDECTTAEDSGGERCSMATLSQELSAEKSEVQAPRLLGNTKHHDIAQVANGSVRGSSSSMILALASTLAAGQSSSSVKDLVSTFAKPQTAGSNLPASKSCSRYPPLIPSFPLKRKQEVVLKENDPSPPKIHQTRPPSKWEPPRFLQKKEVEKMQATVTVQDPQNIVSPLQKSRKPVIDTNKKDIKKMNPCKWAERCREYSSASCKTPKRHSDKGRHGSKMSHEGVSGGEHQNQPKAPSLTSDPRVKDSGRLNPEDKIHILEEAGKSEVLVLTLVYRDGTTQLDPEQKLTPPVCGLLLLMKNNLDCSSPEDSLEPHESLVYLKLEHTPAWAQLRTHQSQDLFTRDLLLQVLSGSQLVVCFKAKDFLRTALHVYRGDISWKQVAGCLIQDPQVSGWLLDPANPSSCYQDLLNKYCKNPCSTPAKATNKVSQVISDLHSLHRLNMELCSKLQNRGLWRLYCDIELSMIPVLAAMESHRIHVDKEALKRTSDLLGTRMKQLEQEAHRAAGQIFLVTSNTQLRSILFEKLCLHERCEKKKLPKTINKQQSTSEAALLQLQDLHPLPKIILEYRQVHKIKSTFVDGILSCMMSKNYISSTWHQTSAVTGRISAKHPNFQALPRQPLRITKKQYIHGKEEEVLTVHPRAMFIPQDGWTFVSADFCQVELRLLAHLSGDPELLRIFINPQADVFTMLASQWKGIGELEVTSEEREHAKRIVYSVVYGAGRERLSGILGVTAEQASRFQDSFLQTYREVQNFIQRTIQQCHKQGYVLSIMGRQRTLPNINSPDWGVRMQAERQAVNFVVQGSAADLCKMAMIRILKLISSSSAMSARLLAQLHDELLYEVKDSHVKEFSALVKSTMESLQHIDHLGVHLKVPLKVAVSSGKSWGSMSELNISPSPSL